MDSKLINDAIKLAKRSYVVVVIPDQTMDGQPVYLASNPQLLGCIAQGDSPEQAVANLTDARIDYIYSLLADNLPVPSPDYQTTETTGGSAKKFIVERTNVPSAVNVTWDVSLPV